MANHKREGIAKMFVSVSLSSKMHVRTNLKELFIFILYVLFHYVLLLDFCFQLKK